MLRYILIRVGWVFIMLVAILTTTFMLLKTAPEFPPTKKEEKDVWLTKQTTDGYMTMEIVDDPQNKLVENPKAKIFVVRIDNSTQAKLFKGVPLINQFFSWVKNIVTRWDWGTSTRLKVNVPAFELLQERIPTTLRLNIIALFVYLPFGLLLGILAALKKNKLTDNIIQIAVMVFISIPGLILIMFLLIIFGYNLQWLPTQFPAASHSTSQQILGLIIPITAMSLPSIAGLSRIMRAELGEVLTSEFVLLARTKGLSYRQAIYRHAIRNSMVPLVPTVIGSFAGLLGGSIVMERVYSIPGTGTLILRALTTGNFDYNVILVSTAFYTVIGLFTTLLVDLSYGIVDPRIRMGASK